MTGIVRIGARNSPLARAQADLVAASLGAYGVESEFVPISTRGDVDRRELTQIGGTGVFTGAVREALLGGTVHLGVHSLKDLPTGPVDGLEIVAYPEREDTREIVVGRWLDDPEIVGGRLDYGIGTGAPRRAAQLRQLASDRGIAIRIEPIRGNVDTRVKLVADGRFDATVLAAAGLRRLNRIEGWSPDQEEPDRELTVGGLPARLLSYDQMLPAAGQGALAVEAATNLDSEIRAVVTRLDHAATRAEVLAERRFLAVLEAGCTAPVGARAEFTSSARVADGGTVRDAGADLTLAAVIGRTKGDAGLITVAGSGSSVDPAELGERLANQVLSIIGPDGLHDHN